MTQALAEPTLKSCEECGDPIPLRGHAPSGRLYLRRRFCSPECSHRYVRDRPRGSVTAKWIRALQMLAARDQHPIIPHEVLPPFGQLSISATMIGLTTSRWLFR